MERSTEAPVCALDEPRFWCAYFSRYCCTSTDSEEYADAEAMHSMLADALGVLEDDAERWWRTFTGYYDGVFEEVDGCVDQPGVVELHLPNRVRVSADFHPGDVYLFLGPQAERIMIGNQGPHFRLPALRVEEVMDVELRDEHAAREALFLSLWSWSTVPKEETQMASFLSRAMARAELVRPEYQETLAEAWLSTIRADDCPWSMVDGVWVCGGRYSVRSKLADARKIQRLLEGRAATD